MPNAIQTNFGTARGAIRLGLSYFQVASGFAHIQRPEAGSVQRLVFLCHGNICRSPFAEFVAKRAGWETASFGLSTSTGKPAYPPVTELADEMGYDLSDHRSITVEDFASQPGDLLIGMEVRHLSKLAHHPKLMGFPRVLLGSYLPMPIPHLHDPYTLAPSYMNTCLQRVEAATIRLCSALNDETPCQ